MQTKKIIIFVLSLSLLSFSGCVSQNKYRGIATELKSTRAQMEGDEVAFKNLQGQNEKLLKENIRLLEDNERLKLELEKRLVALQIKRKSAESETFNYQGQALYSILLSSCQQKDSVQRVLVDYRKADMEPFVIKVNLGEHGIWWRVFAGKYNSRELALAGKNKLGLDENIVLNIREFDQANRSTIASGTANKAALIVKND